MRYSALLAGAGAALLACLAAAGETAKAPDPAAPPAGEAVRDVQDIVYFTDTRPVVIRLHIEVDGKPFQERWDDYLTKLFRHLDRDGDGVLSMTEAGRAPTPPQLLLLFRGQFFNQTPAGADPSGEMDFDNDQEVTADEFAGFYRRAGAGPLQAQPGQNRGSEDPLTNALFSRLDLNQDGKLSKEELAAWGDSFRKLDQDDDELISTQELLPGFNPAAFAPQPQPPRAGSPGLPAGSPFFVAVADGSPKRLTARLQLAKEVQARFDKDKNGRISRTEIGLDDATFQRLDADRDGELDSTELLKLLNPPADIELALRLGRIEGNRAVADILSPDGKPAPLAAAARRTNSGSVMLGLGDAQIDLRRAEGQPVFNNARQFFMQQFRQADQAKQGFVELKQLQQAQFQQLRAAFPVADRDGDGKMTEKELDAYVDLQTAAASCNVTLTVGESGRGLFSLLDGNRDGKLGLRELRTMAARLAPHDRDGDGCISRTELPRQFQVVVSPGQPSISARTVVITPGGGPPAPAGPAPLLGPIWFRKMDRNGDGDLSPREFLGSREDFARLDADGDGLISLEEAEEIDAQLRKAVDPKR